MKIEDNHPKVKYGNTGVLLVNLGTPDSTTWWDIRKYLKEFLSDRRVIELNPFVSEELWFENEFFLFLDLSSSSSSSSYRNIIQNT